MSLIPPMKVEKLQAALHNKAKNAVDDRRPTRVRKTKGDIGKTKGDIAEWHEVSAQTLPFEQFVTT